MAHLERLGIDDVRRPSFDEVDDVLEGGAEVELVAVLLDVADVRRADRVLEAQQQMALQDRLGLEDVDRGHSRSASVERGDEGAFLAALSGLGAEVEAVGEAEPLGRGGGLRLAATRRQEEGPVLALNGDELLDVDFRALLSEHAASGAAGTIVVAQVRSPFGVVEVEEDGTVTGFREAPLLDHWVNSGVYVLGEEALALLPEKGDHEQSTFPQLAGERRLHAHRHEGVWLTVNTPKDLRRVAEFL